MPITYNPKSFATYFPTSFRLLIPKAMVHLIRTLEELSGECNDFGDNELGDRSRIGEGGVEYWDAGFRSRVQIDLICAYAEASDNQQLSRMESVEVNSEYVCGKYLGCYFDHAFGNLRLAPYTNSMVSRNYLHQLVFGHGFGVVIDMESLCSESCNSLLTDIFQN